jgi:endonuclease G
MNCFIKSLIVVFFYATTSSVQAQVKADTLLKAACSENGYQRFLPKAKLNYQVIKHTGFALGYSEFNEQASWVSYVLLPAECIGDEERSSSFYVDPKVSTGSATNDDYKGSGYDRGHLAPAGDMGYSAITMKESFYYSNMSPQAPSFNRGIWKKLESQVRDWSKSGDTILVITGPVLSDSVQLEKIGPNKVSIPKFYFKVIVKKTTNGYTAIGFILPNEASKSDLNSFVVTVDEIEQRTGLDFLPNLAKKEQESLESVVKPELWMGL